MKSLRFVGLLLSLLLAGDALYAQRGARPRERKAVEARERKRESKTGEERKVDRSAEAQKRDVAPERDPGKARQEAFERGRRSEAEVLKSEKLEKNTNSYEVVDPKTGKAGETIPDAVRENGATVEVKDVKRLNDSAQLRRQSEISAQSGQKAEVIVTGRTESVSKTVQDRMRVRRVEVTGAEAKK